MDVPELYPRDLAKLFIDGSNDPSKRPVLILGAGASIPSLPSAYNLKVHIASNAVKQAFGPESLMSKDDKEELEKALKIIRDMCAQEHITLEVLVSLITFRSGNKLDTDAMWEALCADCVVNEFSHIAALLVKLGCIDRILTSNFDHVLEEACSNVDTEYEVVTNVQLEANELNFYADSFMTQICPFHGTTYKDNNSEYTGPFTATAAGLAKPFSKRMAEYVEDSLSNQNRPIIVFGYSGNDHFDLNPLLSSLKLEHENNRSNWFWCIHAGNGNYCSQAIRNVFGAPTPDKLLQSNALYGADTLSVMKNSFDIVKYALSPSTNLPVYEYQPSASIYEERLETWFKANFKWKREEANNMIIDLQSNLTAAWIVSEHYRLIQLGYDEEYCFRFAGVFDVDTSSREIGTYPHLAVNFSLPNGEQMYAEFGYILEAARIYRLEMNDEDQAFSVTSGAMNTFIEQALKCINIAPRQDSDIAALNVGIAIAYDYLGLIGGRHVTKILKRIKKLKRENADASEISELEEILAAARERASKGFEKCIQYASKAKEEINPSLDALIPALTWIQVGLDNMGRFKAPGSDEAINWLMKAIEGRKKMIESDIQQSINAGETDITTSKVVAVDMHYPPLWRRGGELVQQLLETQGFNSAPNKLFSDLNEERLKLAEFGFRTSEEAYERFRELNKAYNLNFPAIYDVRVLMALANRNTLKARKEVEDCRAMLENIPKQEFTESKIRSTTTWIDNIDARIDDFIAQHQSDNKNGINVLSNKELTLIFKEHMDAIGKNSVKGFYYMDKNDNKRVSAKEIQKELNAVGHDITINRAQELIQPFVRPGGELDVYGYLRFLESSN